MPEEVDGYRSPAAKRRLMLFAWTIAIPLYLLQFVLLIAFVGVAVVELVTAIFSAPRVDLGSAAMYEGRLCTVASGALAREDGREPCPEGQHARALSCTDLAVEGTAPVELAVVCEDSMFGHSYLVPDGEALLWITEDRVMRTDVGGRITADDPVRLPSGARVIVHGGRPMAAVVDAEHTTLYALEPAAWVERERRAVGRGDSYDYEVVSDGARLHVFVPSGRTVEHRAEGGASSELPEPLEEWSVSAADRGLFLFGLPPYPYGAHDGEIVVYGHRPEPPSGDLFGSSFGLRAEPRLEWTELARGPSDATEIASAGPLYPGAISRHGGGVALYDLHDDGVRVRRFEGASPLWRMVLWLVLAELAPYALALLAALLLSLFVSRYRTPSYREGVRYASLARRAIAKGVDIVIACAPIAAALFVMRDDTEWLAGPAPMVIAVASGAFFFLVFAALEGVVGATPGKLVTGIRVVDMELGRCGLKGGILRGLGAIVDGMFSGFVGLMVVTFSRHFQRVGDRLAGTVVVRR